MSMFELNERQLAFIVKALTEGGKNIYMCFGDPDRKFALMIDGEHANMTLNRSMLVQIEAALGEALSIVPGVLPYAIPTSLAKDLIPRWLWSTAVRDERTDKGWVEWSLEYAQTHQLKYFM